MKIFKKREWGWWLVLLSMAHFKIKILRFKQHGKCSMQKHKYRSELWLFLRGAGALFNETGYFQIYPGGFQHVPKGTIHCFIANAPTWVLEIQYGEKCEEEDIVRI